MPASSKRYLEYKVVETSTVHDQALEQIINNWVGCGWSYDGIQFAMNPSSRRPSMAFVLFTRELEATEDAPPGGAGPG